MYGQAGVSGEFGARFGVHMRLLERTDGRGETWPVVCGLHGMYGTRNQVSVPQGKAERDEAGQSELEIWGTLKVN